MKKKIFMLAITLLLALFANIGFAQPNWVSVPSVTDLYIDTNYIVFDREFNAISTSTLNIIDRQKGLDLIFGERYFYNNKTNAIYFQILRQKGEIISHSVYPTNEIKACPIELGSDIEKVYYFVYNVAKQQGKI